jgi:septal ring factor EnvC (AmiA/AmiB activator)
MKVIVVLLLMLCCAPLYAQRAIKDMERRKQVMEREIDYISTLISQTKEKQRINIDHLSLLKENISKRRLLLKNIDSQIAMLLKEIERRQQKTQQLTSDMAALKDNYAAMLRAAYRSRNPYEQMMYVLSSDNISQAYRRIIYLKNFSDAIVAHSHKIERQNKELTEEIAALQKSKDEQESLMEQKKTELAELDNEIKNYERISAVLKSQQASWLREMEKKKQEAAQLNRQIEAAIAEETRREAERQKYERERLAAEMKKYKGRTGAAPKPAANTESRFEKLKGTLKMPVNQGVIVTHFGVHNHPVFAHIHVTSNGIDISTSDGAEVKVVADGIVSKIFTTNSVTSILVQHDVYYTVYTHLTNINVSIGDMLRSGQKLGIVARSEDRTILHFELWKQMEKQDPEAWLAKQ